MLELGLEVHQIPVSVENTASFAHATRGCVGEGGGGANVLSLIQDSTARIAQVH